MNLATTIFWLVVIGLVSMYAFFLALGTFDPTETTVATIVALVLAGAWAVHAAMHRGERVDVRQRERRGF